MGIRSRPPSVRALIAAAAHMLVCGVVVGMAQPLHAAPHAAVDWHHTLHTLPSLAWRPYSTASVVVSPHGTWVYAAGKHGVAAFDARSGKERWRAAVTDGVDGAPTLDGRTLWVVSTAGALQAFDGITGLPRWDEPVALDVVVSAAPAVDARHVYVPSTTGTLLAVDKRDGKVVWRHQRPLVRDFLIEGHASPVLVDDLVLLGLGDGKLVCLSARDGGFVWEAMLGDPRRGGYVDVDATPLVVPGGARDGSAMVIAASHNGGVQAFSLRDGSVIWRDAAATSVRWLGLNDGRLYGLAAEGSLHAWDPMSGRALLRRGLAQHPTGGATFFGTSLMVPGELGLDVIARDDGELRYRLSTPRGFAAAPAVVGRRLWAVDNGGSLWAWRYFER